MTTSDPVRFNPLWGNPLKTRDDVRKAMSDCFAPLLPYFSEGGARVPLGGGSAHYDQAAADLEGFARPLWGIVPFVLGGGEFAHWDLYRNGLANGTNPDHPEYWGNLRGYSQRLVELAAVGLALRLVPEHLWEPLSEQAKANVSAYLLEARRQDFVLNNWQFFRVLIDMGLEQCGISFDSDLTTKALDAIDSFYIGDGWYRDGRPRQVDHYIAFAFHFYGLLFAQLHKGDDPRAARFKERARQFAGDFQHWFDEDGGTLAFGRSMTYRFACGALWGALAFADVDALPWGEIKGHYLRHLRWWSEQPIADRDGVLSVGFAYPNLLMSENYNSSGSPYWAFKVFLPLALPEDHPFWAAEELPASFDAKPVVMRHPGMVMMHTPNNVVALAGGQQSPEIRHASEKYSKFVYSSRYAFSIEPDGAYDQGVFDGMLALSDDKRHYRVREGNSVVRVAGDTIFARWLPWADVKVETWLKPATPWHIRIHRITTPRPLYTTEGGFSVPLIYNQAKSRSGSGEGFAIAHTSRDITAIVDLKRERTGRNMVPSPNSNLIAPRTIVPQLRGQLPSGTSILITAAMALPTTPFADKAVQTAPAVPDLAELEGLFAWASVEVSAMKRLAD